MKIITMIFFMLFGVVFISMAQEPIEVKIEQRTSSMGVHPAFEVKIPQATQQEAIDLWKKTITPNKLLKKTSKMEKVEDEWIVNDVLIKEITSSPLDVITHVDKYTGHIYIRVFLKDGQEFVGEEGGNDKIASAASEYIKNYGVELYRLAVEGELREEEKVLSSLESDLGKLEKQSQKYREKISENSKEQRDFVSEVEYGQQLKKNGLQVTSEEKKEAESQLKSAKKDLKKAEKEESRLRKKIKENNKAQQDKSYEIEKQEKEIEQLHTKLKNIK